MTSCTRSAQRIWGILKKVVGLRTGHRTRRVDFRLLAEALGRCHTRWRGRWKSQNRKNVYLSPYVEEPLNSKVIKSFVPELRSRYVFFEFRDSYVLCIHIWTLYVHFAYPYLAMAQEVRESRTFVLGKQVKRLYKTAICKFINFISLNWVKSLLKNWRYKIFSCSKDNISLRVDIFDRDS